ncbi:putative PAS/PAC sensor protein [Frankia casuarinae]|uniref:protein-serine/threonine phosphatase n=1 Tax=Frankia casuarinae (strain DSM 45818 / CECT 9043 / HFP020203 / CcI3) TaxID=106370 RepID=Q2JBH9_FRACC|nr:putative PAS/PAC sensor protein [Frankia casuarinae]
MTSEPRRTLSDVSSDYALDAGFDSLLGTQLIDFSPTAMVIIDPDLRVRRSNRSFREIYGLSPEQLAGTSIPELLPDMDPRVWKLARWVLASGESVEDTEIIGRSVAFPQEERTWRFSHFPLRDREGVPAAVGVTLVDVTDQRRAERKHAEAERRLRLLTRASTLVGRSLELDATLASIADFMVPEFADTCSVYLLDEPLDTDARPELLELRRAIKTRVSGPPLQSCDIPFSAAGEILYCHRNSPIYQAFASGRPFHHAADDESLISGYQTPGFLDYFRRLLLRWGIAVPLLVGRYFHGVMVVHVGVSGRTYTDDDVEMAANLGGRISAAIANARAYAREREVSVTLQRSLLAPDIPAVAGMDIAWRYEPGSLPGRSPCAEPGPPIDAEVGGDWFDLIPLSAGRVALVIGDVAGRGVTAAAVMGQLRTASRAFASLDLPADDVLTHLDNLAQTIGAGPDGALASCVYAIFEPTTATIVLANAGHPPPALRDPDGRVRLLTGGGGAFLGIGGQVFVQTCYPFPVGATLALYTDGLVESRDIDIFQGIGRLQHALADAGTADATADRLMRLVDQANRDDDVALLLVRAAAAINTRTLTIPLTLDLRAVGQARHAVNAALRRWQQPETIETAELLVSEIVTNAIRYSRVPGELVLRSVPTALYIEVSDSDSHLPRVLHPNEQEEHGRGLILVDALAARWGTRPTHSGKTVWCQLDTGTDTGPEIFT